MATIKDVAREAGVAVSTVSKYINGGNVLEPNRLAIEAAVKKLNYRTNYIARAMRSGRSRTVMVLVPQLENRYCCQIVKTARKALLKNGYATLIAESNCDVKEEQQALQSALLYRYAGIITMSNDISMPLYKELRRSRIPYVSIGRAPIKSGNCICFNDKKACTEMVSHLLKQGHRRMGLVTGAFEYKRLKAMDFAFYTNLIQDSGFTLDEKYIFSSNGEALTCGGEAVDYFLSMPSRPTVLICLSAELLYGAYVRLLDLGLRVPEDMLLCGVVGQNITEITPFDKLPCLCMPIEDATERAVSLLIENIHDLIEGNTPASTTIALPGILSMGEYADYTVNNE